MSSPVWQRGNLISRDSNEPLSISYNATMYFAGIMGYSVGLLAPDSNSIRAQTRRALDTISETIDDGIGDPLNRLLSCRVYLTNMHDHAVVHDVMRSKLEDPWPVITYVGVTALINPSANVMLEVVAYHKRD